MDAIHKGSRKPQGEHQRFPVSPSLSTEKMPPVEMAPGTSQSPTDDAVNPQVEMIRNQASSTTTRSSAPKSGESPAMAGYEKAEKLPQSHQATSSTSITEPKHMAYMPQLQEESSFEPATTHLWDKLRFTLNVQKEIKRGEDAGNLKIPKVAVIDGGFCNHFPSLRGRIRHRRAFDDKGIEIDPHTVGPEGCAHGTSCAFLIGGEFDYVDYHGIKMGTGRGGLPSCLLGLYALPIDVTLQSVHSAVTAAINDGYEIISFSFTCKDTSNKNFGLLTSSLYFWAMISGVMLCLPAGNDSDGIKDSFWNTCPFAFTVAACESKNPMVTELEVEGGGTIKGPYINLVEHTQFYVLRDATEAYHMVLGGEKQLRKDCAEEFSQAILVFRVPVGQNLHSLVHDAIKLKARGVVFICGDEEVKPIPLMTTDIAIVSIGNEDGNQILNFIKQNPRGMVRGKIHKSKVEENPLPVRLANFSSRLPTRCPGYVYKPEISAPGCQICAVLQVQTANAQPEYEIIDGTSFATPIVVALIAFLKEMHPDWTFAEIRSAIMTCCDVFESFRDFRDRIACGTGVVNPEKAYEAPLLYDITRNQYCRMIQGDSTCDGKMVDIAKNFYDASMDAPEKKNPYSLNLPAFKAVISVDPQNPEPIVYKRKVRLADGGKGTFLAEFDYDGCNREHVILSVDPPMLKFKGKNEDNERKKERLCYTVTVIVRQWNLQNLISCRLKWIEVGGKCRVSMCPIVIDKL